MRGTLYEDAVGMSQGVYRVHGVKGVARYFL